MRERMERIRGATEAESLTEVIRRALATYEALIEFSGYDRQVILRNNNGDEVTLLLVP